MNKPTIPQPTAQQVAINKAVKENLEAMQGLRGGRLKPLAETATLSDVIEAYNDLLERIQA